MRLELVLVGLSPGSRTRKRTTIPASPLRPWKPKQSEDFPPDAVTCREDVLVAEWFPDSAVQHLPTSWSTSILGYRRRSAAGSNRVNPR